MVPPKAIRPNPAQPRKRFDQPSLEGLAASIRAVGILQPLLVRRDGDGFVLVAGERRWRAAQMAGLEQVPVLIEDLGDRDSLEHAVVENLHRQDLGALEEAAAYRQLIDEFHLSHDEVANRVGKSRAAISNSLRLLQLPSKLQQMLADGQLTAGHARAILALEGSDRQEALAQRVVAGELSVRQTEELARSFEQPKPEKPEATRVEQRDPAVLEVETSLAEALETVVEVKGSRRRGRLVIHFADSADLSRIYERLLAPPPAQGAGSEVAAAAP